MLSYVIQLGDICHSLWRSKGGIDMRDEINFVIRQSLEESP
jgi:hypothetical protein